MSPRPRRNADSEIFEAVRRLKAHRGPEELTLADVALEIDLTPGGLVQRFGSKRGLLLAASRAETDATRDRLAAIRAGAASPMAAIYAWAESETVPAGRTADLLRRRLWEAWELADPDFRPLRKRRAKETRRALESWVAEAIEFGEIPRGDAERIARTIELTARGSVELWARQREGRPSDRLKEDLRAALLRRDGTSASPVRP